MSENASARSLLTGPLGLTIIACLLVVVGVIVFGMRGGNTPGMEPAPQGQPPILTRMPEFALTDQTNQPYGSPDLQERVWVANFIFTTCPSVCPELTSRMAELQKRTADRESLRLVSFSVDPENDTPEVLAKYAALYDADPQRWKFLTGAPEDVKETIETGLKVSMGAGGEKRHVNDILHGTHFVLLDGQARIRGYYDVKTDAGLDVLIGDIESLETPGEADTGSG